MAKRVLIVCRAWEDASFLAAMDYQPERTYILASDDVRVQRLRSRYPSIRETCYIERKESLYAIAASVVELNGALNEWLGSLTHPQDAIPPSMLAWPCVAEGGMTTQRIQDVLLLVDSYLHLLQTRQVSEVVLRRNGRSAWEDAVLVETARSLGIPIRLVGAFRGEVVRGRAAAALRSAGRQPYYMARLVLAKLQGRRWNEGTPGPGREVAFQLCGSNDRHVENILPIMAALRSMGYEALALCWRATAGGGESPP